MSLAKRPRHTIHLQPVRRETGTIGQIIWVPDGPPLALRCNVHATTGADRRIFYYGATWPGDINCRISYDGDEWDQTEEAAPHQFGSMTRHWEIPIRRRGANGPSIQ